MTKKKADYLSPIIAEQILLLYEEGDGLPSELAEQLEGF